MDKTITRLEPTIPPIPRKTRVAAYARVSSGKNAMLHSLSSQVSYYNEYIQRHPGWTFAGVYADEAITGTKSERGEFQRLLEDCREGRIDLIITKSISRFARNTVTLLETVRELKGLGIEVYFENENIHTKGSGGELLLTIIASIAQEESRSVSENCKWRIRNDFKRGIPGNITIYGYRQKKGVLTIVPKEAEVVRMIFRDYLDGMGRNLIVKKLRDMGVKTLWGADFRENQIIEMLRNEKYVGDLLLQKTFLPSHLEKQKMRNKGELPMYLARDAHEAIVDRDTFDRVQAEIKRRAEIFVPHPKKRETYPLTGKITCGHCGKNFRRKTVVSPRYPPRVVWICSTFNTLGRKACPAKSIPENVLLETAASVLGITAFDKSVFNKSIKEIQVPEANRLCFVFRDGHVEERVWEDRSRRDSWTDEMRAKARERERARSNELASERTSKRTSMLANGHTGEDTERRDSK